MNVYRQEFKLLQILWKVILPNVTEDVTDEAEGLSCIDKL